MKRIHRFLKFLKVWDGLWSIPLAMLLFFATGYVLVDLYGPEAGSMMPVYVQRLFYASLASVVCNFFVLMGMYMNWEHIFNHYLKELSTDWQSIEPVQRVRFVFVLYSIYVVMFVLFYIFV